MVAFIILHYKNISDTIECIESINKLSIDDYKVIVVDNNSNDDDIFRIKKYTKDVIVSKKNLGFANGNNLGCSYARKKYNPDFLIVINNDTIINQKQFIKIIYSDYKKYQFDILGPKIITNGGESVNPFPVYKTIEEINHSIKKNKVLKKIYSSIILRNLLLIYIKIKDLFFKKRHCVNGVNIEKNCALHGCALIFSKKYCKKYEDVFFAGTFLYHEEEFLEYRREKDDLITIYDPNLKIFHKEGASLNNNFNNAEYKKLIFKSTEIIKSLTLLKKIIEKEKNGR